MLVEIKKYKGTYVDKTTGQTKNCTHFYVLTPGGRGIQIRNVFKEDNGKLDLLIPTEEKKPGEK